MTRRRGLTAWLLAAGCLLVTLPGAAPAHASALERALSGWERLVARFEQRVLDEGGKVLEESRGEVAVARPRRFRWDYVAPYRQSIVADGERVWVYDPALDQVTVRPYGATSEMGLIAILESPQRVARTFAVEDLPAADGLDWVRLTPREAERFEFEWMAIGVDAEGLAALRLADRLGQVSEIRLSQRRFDAPIDPQRFVFLPPPGTDVVEVAGS